MFARVSVAFSELDERSSAGGPLEGDILLFCKRGARGEEMNW